MCQDRATVPVHILYLLIMLNFLNNYLSEFAELLYDQHEKICYLLIYKNGTRSLVDLHTNDPSRYKHYLGNNPKNFIKEYNISTVTIFVRDPIARFLSGLYTQSYIYGMSIDKVAKDFNKDNDVRFFDAHTIPQFWFLLRFSNQCPTTLLNIVDFSELKKIVKSQLNRSLIKYNINILNDTVRNKIDHYYTEDIVLYNQFINSTVTIDQIIKKIKLEKNFVNDILQYNWYNKIYT